MQNVLLHIETRAPRPPTAAPLQSDPAPPTPCPLDVEGRGGRGRAGRNSVVGSTFTVRMTRNWKTSHPTSRHGLFGSGSGFFFHSPAPCPAPRPSTWLIFFVAKGIAVLGVYWTDHSAGGGDGRFGPAEGFYLCTRKEGLLFPPPEAAAHPWLPNSVLGLSGEGDRSTLSSHSPAGQDGLSASPGPTPTLLLRWLCDVGSASGRPRSLGEPATV